MVSQTAAAVGGDVITAMHSQQHPTSSSSSTRSTNLWGSSILQALVPHAGTMSAAGAVPASATAAVVPWSAGSQVLQLPAYTSYGSTPFFPVIYSVREPAAAQSAAGPSQHATTTSTVSPQPAASTSNSSSSSSSENEHGQHISSSSSSSGSKQRPWSEMWRSAGAHALGGGIPGSAAMVVQVRTAGCTCLIQS